MIREQSRFTINPVYVVAIAMCCVSSCTVTLKSGLLFSLIIAVVALLCINLVSIVEKIADKNLRAFLIALLASALFVLCDYLFEYIGTELLIANQANIKWALLSVIALSIIPTYFETRLSTKNYFANLFLSTFLYILLTIIYALIMEFMKFGTLWDVNIIYGFNGFVFADQLFFELFVIAMLIIVCNIIYQKVEDKKMRFEVQVERYKMQIKQTLTKKAIRDQREGQDD